MSKSHCVVLLFILLNLGIKCVIGQSTITSGDCNNDEREVQKYSHAFDALSKTIQLEFQKLRAQMQMEKVVIHDDLQGLCPKLSR